MIRERTVKEGAPGFEQRKSNKSKETYTVRGLLITDKGECDTSCTQHDSTDMHKLSLQDVNPAMHAGSLWGRGTCKLSHWEFSHHTQTLDCCMYTTCTITVNPIQYKL